MENLMKYVLALAFPLLLIACNSKSKLEKEIETIPMDVEIVRFDRIFANTEPEDLYALKKKYPLFFPEQYHDTVWLNRMKDTLQGQLNEAVQKTFPDSYPLEEGLTSLFQHITYYFPEFKVPKVYTTTSDVDYRTKVIANDSLLILELDTFLGREHPFYEGLPLYISQNLDPSRLIPDLAFLYARKFAAPPSDRSLLGQMIYYGKLLYLSELWLPEETEGQIIGYTEEDWSWAQANEEEIWKYFVEKEYLYDTNPKLQQRFIDPAPFSKFNLEIDNESPGMIGRWLGWQIVNSYMEHNDVSLYQMLNTPTETLFSNSKYKPRR